MSTESLTNYIYANSRVSTVGTVYRATHPRETRSTFPLSFNETHTVLPSLVVEETTRLSAPAEKGPTDAPYEPFNGDFSANDYRPKHGCENRPKPFQHIDLTDDGGACFAEVEDLPYHASFSGRETRSQRREREFGEGLAVPQPIPKQRRTRVARSKGGPANQHADEPYQFSNSSDNPFTRNRDQVNDNFEYYGDDGELLGEAIHTPGRCDCDFFKGEISVQRLTKISPTFLMASTLSPLKFFGKDQLLALTYHPFHVFIDYSPDSKQFIIKWLINNLHPCLESATNIVIFKKSFQLSSDTLCRMVLAMGISTVTIADCGMKMPLRFFTESIGRFIIPCDENLWDVATVIEHDCLVLYRVFEKEFHGNDGYDATVYPMLFQLGVYENEGYGSLLFKARNPDAPLQSVRMYQPLVHYIKSSFTSSSIPITMRTLRSRLKEFVKCYDNMLANRNTITGTRIETRWRTGVVPSTSLRTVNDVMDATHCQIAMLNMSTRVYFKQLEHAYKAAMSTDISTGSDNARLSEKQIFMYCDMLNCIGFSKNEINKNTGKKNIWELILEVDDGVPVQLDSRRTDGVIYESDLGEHPRSIFSDRSVIADGRLPRQQSIFQRRVAPRNIPSRVNPPRAARPAEVPVAGINIEAEPEIPPQSNSNQRLGGDPIEHLRGPLTPHVRAVMTENRL